MSKTSKFQQISKDVYFFHVRPLEKTLIKVPLRGAFYYTEKLVPAQRGGKTYAVRFNKKTNKLEYALSKCSKKDNFNRKIGRMISAGRLHVGKEVKEFTAYNLEEFANFIYGYKH